MIRKTVTTPVPATTSVQRNEQPLADCNSRVSSLFQEKSDLTAVELRFADGSTKLYEQLG